MGIFDALAALAAGGQVFVDKKHEDSKNALIEKMEADREARAEQRQIAAERRKQLFDLTIPKSSEITTDADGAHWVQYRNEQGDIIKKTLASADQIDDKNRADKKEQLGLDYMQSQIDENKAQAAALPVKAGLEARLTQAQIDNLASEKEARLHPRPTASTVDDASKVEFQRLAAQALAEKRKRGTSDADFMKWLITAPLPLETKKLLGYYPSKQATDE